jgi:hypothetical protein
LGAVVRGHFLMRSLWLRPHWIPLVCILALYAAFPTRTYYWDGVLFSLNIESVAQGRASPAMLIHPNHLLYSAFGYILYRAVLACGLTLRAITVLEIFNSLASAAAAAVLYAIAKRLTSSTGGALLCLTLFAFGATWWKFSTDADPYIVSVLLLLLAIYFATQEPPRLLPAAVCHIASMLFHQLAIFTYPAVLTAILFRYPRGKRSWLCAAYVAGTGACVAAAYWICYLHADHSASPSFAKFVTSYASDSDFTRSPSQIVQFHLTSYLKLFFGGKLSLIGDYFSFASGLSLAVGAAALGYAVIHLRTLSADNRVRRSTLLVIWVWLLPGAIFLAIWDPGSAFHKLFVWPAIVLLLGAYAAWRRPAPSIALAVAMAAWNFSAFIYPHAHSSADPVLVFAQKVDRELPKNATIYYSAFSPDDWYLDYFAPGRMWIRFNGASPTGAYCLDTTALEASKPATAPTQSWALVSPQHNIRLQCFRRQ